MKTAALIPVKGFANAKQRLSAHLSAAQRAVLAETMMRDVVAEAVAARGLDAVYVVTGNEYVSKLAAALGARAILEEAENGETGAVEFALAELKRRGVDAALVIPADMPLVRAVDLEQVIGQTRSAAPFALLVPSHDRMGTNALLLAPPDVMAPAFGEGSFARHAARARAAGAAVKVADAPSLELDVDTPDDLAALRRALAARPGGARRTRALLEAAAVA